MTMFLRIQLRIPVSRLRFFLPIPTSGPSRKRGREYAYMHYLRF